MQKTFWLDSTTVRATLLGIIPMVYQLARAFGLDFPDGVLEELANGAAALISVVAMIWTFAGRFNPDIKPLTTDKTEATEPPPTG